MYRREECLVQASICREKAKADPARYDYWIDRAIVWLQRAIQASRGNGVAHATPEHDSEASAKQPSRTAAIPEVPA
jgi:hypothetical protein